MENGTEGSIPMQQAETPTSPIGIPVTEMAEPKKGKFDFLKKLFARKKEEPMAVGSGMAEQLAPMAAPLDSGTFTTDMETASTATAQDAGITDATSVLNDVTKQIDNTAQMSAHINNPMPGIPPVTMENPVSALPPDVPPTTTTAAESTTTTPPSTEQAA